MNKAIFLCDKSHHIQSVFEASVIENLQALTELDQTVYTRKEILESPHRFADTEIIFSTWGMPSFDEAELALCFPNLRAVFYAAGSVQSFARPFLNRGVHVFSAWAANAVPVAEYTMAQILLANKGFFSHAYLMKQKKITEARALSKQYHGNYGEKVGLIGCGMIGSLVAEMLKPYKLDVLVYDPFFSQSKATDLNVTVCSLDKLFSSCRVVSNHLANNEATQGILTYQYFSKMLPYSTFLNTGRGAQVNEADLVRILEERPDLTAVLDVTYPEPADPSHRFYTLPNCILTPHIAGSLGNEVCRMAEYMYDEFLRFCKDEPCEYEVTADMLKTMA